jgi:hypothetical protein
VCDNDQTSASNTLVQRHEDEALHPAA